MQRRPVTAFGKRRNLLNEHRVTKAEEAVALLDGGVFGKSITDPCLGWEKTDYLIHEIDGKVVIDDELKTAIDAYYEQYGARE